MCLLFQLLKIGRFFGKNNSKNAKNSINGQNKTLLHLTGCKYTGFILIHKKAALINSERLQKTFHGILIVFYLYDAINVLCIGFFGDLLSLLFNIHHCMPIKNTP